MAELYQDKDWLYEHYIVREESPVAMAREAGCSDTTIRYWLHKLEIPVRSCGEGQFLAKRNSVNITPDLLEFLGGEIIGDGCVPMNGNRSALYRHSSALEEYLTWLSGRFDAWGIEQVGQIRGYKDKESGTMSYRYASKSYPELVPIYERWYPDGKKIVPKDLRLTPIMARQWYLGDGGLTSDKHPGIIFSTQGFTKEEVEYLVKELNNLGFKATRQPASNKIRISVYSVKDFLGWIGPCPIACYQYEWDYEKNAQ